MIREIISAVDELTSSKRGLSCLVLKCDAVTEWRFLPEKVNVLDILTAVGAVGSFLAVVAAAIAIFQSAKARNLATVIELTRQLASEREKAFAAEIYDMEPYQFHAYQMVHLIEQASMIVNQGWVSGKSREFLLDWLRLEIPAMTAQPAYKAELDNVTGQQLCELLKLRDRFEAERKKEEHFERIYRQSKARTQG